MIQPPSNDYIQPAKKYARSEFIDYDFSKMTDTKGGFLNTIDDPHNKAMWKGMPKEEQKPDGMTMAEWERDIRARYFHSEHDKWQGRRG
jgi:DNA-repair protein complementing XP-A cells